MEHRGSGRGDGVREDADTGEQYGAVGMVGRGSWERGEQVEEERCQNGREQTDAVQDQSEAAVSEEGDSYRVDEKRGAGNVAKAEQTGELCCVDLSSATEGNRCFRADRETADQPHEQGADTRSGDAEQSSEGAFTELPKYFAASACHQQLGQNHKGKE